MLRALLAGDRPRDGHLTRPELAAARAALGLSQSALGELLDLDDATIVAYESGDRGPPPLVVRAITWLEEGWQPEPPA